MGIYKDLEGEFDYEIVEEFLNHYSSMIGVMEKLIISLENPSTFANKINELFRMFHTIKSASAYLKITPIHKIAVLAEEILQECRELQGAASEVLIEWFLLLHDQLNNYKTDLENDHENFSKLNKNIIKVPIEYLR